MTELELYRFVKDSSSEYHWHEHNHADDVIMFVTTLFIADFIALLGCEIMDEEGIECIMKHGYFCFWMNDICQHFDIELNKIFERE